MPSNQIEATYFLHWGVVQLSLANLLVIAAMVVVFVAAVAVRFPERHADKKEPGNDDN